MKKFILNNWNLVMNNRYNPLRHLEMASQHYFMQVLAWMWSMIFSLSFLSIFQFHTVWVSHLLVISGAFITLIVFQQAEERSAKKVSVAENLSHGSACLWKMDREA
jgi:hypothetical protein